MTTEAVENQEVEVVADDDAAFAAGFSEARGDEPPAAEPAPEPEQAEAPATAPAAEQAPDPEPQPTLIAGLTEEQIKTAILKANEVDSLKAQIEKSFGKYGELNRTIQQLQQQRTGGLQIDKAKLTRLSGEFPEIAEMLAADLSEALTGAGGSQQSAIDPDSVEALIQARLEEARREDEKRVLKRTHRDWNEVVTSDDFKLWQQNVLPPEEAQALATSWDADFISDKIADFKAWRTKSTAAKETKQKRLEQAVTPRGDTSGPSTVQTEEEAFAAAFKTARGR